MSLAPIERRDCRRCASARREVASRLRISIACLRPPLRRVQHPQDGQGPASSVSTTQFDLTTIARVPGTRRAASLSCCRSAVLLRRMQHAAEFDPGPGVLGRRPRRARPSRAICSRPEHLTPGARVPDARPADSSPCLQVFQDVGPRPGCHPRCNRQSPAGRRGPFAAIQARARRLLSIRACASSMTR